MESIVYKIVERVREMREYDFSGCSEGMLSRRIMKRFPETGTRDFGEYLDFLQVNPEECDLLLPLLTIKVSQFFRNGLDFGYLEKILGIMHKEKEETGMPLRIWSAGCATGEEPYSAAILLAEQQHLFKQQIQIFATDIDGAALEVAKKGKYNSSAISEMKYGLVQKYFHQEEGVYTLTAAIRQMVSFSEFDILHKRRSVPEESIYGDFDLVLCRNVLIYYKGRQHQEIMRKLYESLGSRGYLILGEAETPGEEYQNKLQKYALYTSIYRKLVDSEFRGRK